MATEELKISSSVFRENEMIPVKYTCDGEDISPPLKIEAIPGDTKSLVLIVEDPDAPAGTWDHWLVWNISPGDKIPENTNPGTQGINSFKKHSYGGPCPPSDTHRYFFKCYALDSRLDIPENSDKRSLEKAMSNHILAKGELIGLYKKQNK